MVAVAMRWSGCAAVISAGYWPQRDGNALQRQLLISMCW